jgi:hypothetical protein
MFFKRKSPKETKPRRPREFTAYVLINHWGFSIHWNAFDLMHSRTGLYKLAFYDGRLSEARIWWEFLWDEQQTNASLDYSHGRNHKQVAGWTLRGPLVKFTKAQLT